MNYTTVKFRIKDSTSHKHLERMAMSVNYVWNYCNEVNQERWKKFGKTFSNYDLHKLTSGCGKDLGLRSSTIQSICDHFVQSCRQQKRVKLKWRSRSRSLGWIPFKSNGVRINGDAINYKEHTFRFWASKKISNQIRFGSFTKSAKGQWFVNLVVEGKAIKRVDTGCVCGVDLGLKTLITLSDGSVFNRTNLTKKYQLKLAIAQRAKKEKLVKATHQKIKNQRKDWNHKVSSLITIEYDQIFIGDVSSSQLKKTRMAKSVSDAGWYDFKRMLEYKAIRLGSVYKEVNESFSTVTCSVCNERSGPKGLLGLKVREWTCSCCGASHLRDVNAAKNILRLGHQSLTKGISE